MKRKIMTWSMLALFLSGCLSLSWAAEKDHLVFGAIAVGKVSKVRESLTPFMQYLEKEIGAKIAFETGKDYPDTIAKFQSGHFDFGYIGPSPYVIASSGKLGADNFRIIAGLETNKLPYYHAVIIAAKENAEINVISDLRAKRFAFGSRQSTLSCYLPCKVLMDSGVFGTLTEYKFLGKHDKVARDVSMGRYDGGGIKEAVANKNLDRIKIIAKSEPVYDFLMVAHKNMDTSQYEKIKTAVFKLKDPAILNSIKKGVTGFIETKDSNYDNLREIMEEVDRKLEGE
jgi:phosphonate transport system substrate-binding protein